MVLSPNDFKLVASVSKQDEGLEGVSHSCSAGQFYPLAGQYNPPLGTNTPHMAPLMDEGIHSVKTLFQFLWSSSLLKIADSKIWPLHRGQREFSIPGILDESQLHFFSLDHEKWFSEVSISSRNMRVTKWNLVLVSKYENGHMIISISSRQARARKIILNLVSKNCTFSREWDSKSNPIIELHSNWRQFETKWFNLLKKEKTERCIIN